MVRLSLELITGAPQFVNPLQEREIDLHNTDLSLIEGTHISSIKAPVVSLLRNFDTLNLSRNSLSRLEGFPIAKDTKLVRIKTIHCHSNNDLNFIQPTIAEALPLLHTVSFYCCNFTSIAQLTPLAKVPGLRSLSLMGNPISEGDNYRNSIRDLLPDLVYLDHCRLPQTQVKTDSPKKTKRERENSTSRASKAPKAPIPSKEELIEKLSQAKDLDEVNKIEKMLKKHYSSSKNDV
ncbi:U2 small nuclear ribonucleoprotein A [Perkinsela sp. CCAP 1560/4]|nr:U2 small nuclear ribonucleoprotein A [Perkinsela sp. CCAP 1560/4]|eukprot:KNH03790.1 U2 small nuclear ribonucleoprotein A [Perkinsela sp. CCAP 1560/4]